MQISKNKPISVSVSIDFQGTAAGSKAGGVFQTQETQLEVEGLPADLPTSIEVDVSGLDIGDRLTAADIKLDKGLTLVTSPESIIASVMPPQAAEEEPTASAEEAEPAAEEKLQKSKPSYGILPDLMLNQSPVLVTGLFYFPSKRVQ